jgi:hypothetical protein
LRSAWPPVALAFLARYMPGKTSSFCETGTVKVVLDEHFKSFKSLCFHPLTNAATISIATVDLVKFLDACGHSPEWFDFGAPLGAESQALMQAAPPSASTTPEPTPAASPDCASGTTPLQEDTVQVSQLPSREALEDVGFYLCVGMRVWVAGTGSGAAAAAGVVVRAPSDQVGVWTVRTAADGEEQLASWQQIWPRSVFTPVASPPAPKVSNDDVSSPLCSSPGLEGVPGEIHCKLVAPVDGKSAADGGRWTVRIQAGSSKGQPSARVVCTLLPPAGGKSAEDGGKWAVRIHASIGDGGETDTGSGSTQLVTPSPLVIPDTPRLDSPAPPPFGAEDPVERAGTVCSELGLSVEKRQHQACVASEGKTSNQHHHEVLSDVDGHIVVTLFLKGQKKKELIMLIKKPASKLNLKAFGRAPEVGVVGNAVRMADAKALQASIGMEPDFVSPLSLVNALDKGVVLHKVLFDAALQDGKPLWCLPPMVNTASWGWSLLDAVRFAQGCGQSVGLIELEAGSAALALAPRPVVRSSASSLPVQLVPPADGKGAAEGGKWTVNIGACLGGAAAAASAVEQAKGARLAKLSLVNAPLVNPGPSQPWWSGKPMSPCCVVDKLAELGLSSDDVQAATMEEEIASWCTSLFVKCKKTKKHFMITSRPGVKVDLKKVAKQIGAKELRIAQDKAALGFTSDYTGCLTAMSVLGDREGAVASVLDKQILDLGNDCRMCSGCDDFRDHTQHHISSVPPAMLLQMLEDSGHPPKLVDM